MCIRCADTLVVVFCCTWSQYTNFRFVHFVVCEGVESHIEFFRSELFSFSASCDLLVECVHLPR